jgi:hypothetical protein
LLSVLFVALGLRARGLRLYFTRCLRLMDVYTLADAIKAAAPRDTDIGYQKVGWTITNGIKPTANAGGIWALRIAIEQTIVNETPKKPA